jgi:hypothetical protein
MSVTKARNLLAGSHFMLAQMVHKMQAKTLACTNSEECWTWYEFKNHRWCKIKKIATLHRRIKQSLVPRLLREKKRLWKAISKDEKTDDDFKENIKTIENLDLVWFRDNIIKEMADLFYDENINFIKLLDANIDLIGFDNGIFDIRTMSFRDGRPDDYVSKSVGYYQDVSDVETRISRINAIRDHKQTDSDSKDTSYDGFIYLLREREFIKTNEPIFKFGKTKSSNASHRINSYPKDSEICYIEKVKNCDQLEKDILVKLRFNFDQRTDIGREYFEGKIEDILKLIKIHS